MTKKIETKKPVGQRVGRVTTKATMGLAYWLGRTGARVGKDLYEGALDAGREIKRGYDEAASEK
jgi:hypothetical protein